MRRKSERAAKKAKASPEKKVEKAKRTRTRRRKQSSSSENESADDSSPAQTVETVEETVVEEVTPTPAKDDSPEESQEVWHVKTAETSGDVGDIKKLKLCLSRPSSTPERVEKSPRSKRKHSRATSSSDSHSVEGVSTPEKRKSRHRSKLQRDSKDETDQSQEEQDAETESRSETAREGEVSQSTSETQQQSLNASEETSVSTSNEESSNTKGENSATPVDNEQCNHSAADTTVASPKNDPNLESSMESESPEDEKNASNEQSEVLEIHAEDKIEPVEIVQKKEEKESKKSHRSKGQDMASSKKEVSIIEDKKVNSVKVLRSGENDAVETTNKTDVVEGNHGDENRRMRNISTDSDKDKDESNRRFRGKDLEIPDSEQEAQQEMLNGQTPPTPIVVSRKRKWGSRPKIAKQKSITISTDVLKDIIPDVKPVEFNEVIEEKKQRRIEVVEKLERPVLPKIVIDNTHNPEQDKKANEDINIDKVKEPHMATNRRISIVKEEDNFTARPPSPPRHKQSNILYITNLVRPFTLPQLKNLLQRTGRIEENGFWIDRIKSKCYVKYENEDQAVETRHALHGVTWPVSNPKTLQVDFSTQEAFDKAMQNDDADATQTSTIPGTVEDWIREQDMRRERGEQQDLKPWERKAAMREWDMGKNEKDKEKDKLRRDERQPDKRRHRTPSPEPARKFKKKEEEAPAKLLDDLFRKTKTTPCIYWLPLSAETIAVKEEQRRQHMAEHERRLSEQLRRTQHRRH